MKTYTPGKHTYVVNMRNSSYDVCVGRPSIFGNPFLVGPDGTREQVIEKYRQYFYSRIKYDPEFKAAVLALRGKILGCFCKPLPCHGQVIADYLNGLDKEGK